MKEVDIMSKKMSYVSAIDAALSGAPIEGEVRERLTALRESVAKRATRKAGPTKAQIANAAIAEKIVAAMVSGEVYGTAEIAGLVPELEGATPQKISPLMRKLAESGQVVAEKVKGKQTYRLA